MLLSLHVLLPAIGPNWHGPHTHAATHRSPIQGFTQLRKFFQQKGKPENISHSWRCKWHFRAIRNPDGEDRKKSGQVPVLFDSVSVSLFSGWLADKCCSSADIPPSARSGRNNAPRLKWPCPAASPCPHQR